VWKKSLIFERGTLSSFSLIVVSVFLSPLDWVRCFRDLIAFLSCSADKAHLDWCEGLREEMDAVYSLMIQINRKLEEMGFNSPEDSNLAQQVASPTPFGPPSAAATDPSEPSSAFSPADNGSPLLDIGAELSRVELPEDQNWETEHEDQNWETEHEDQNWETEHEDQNWETEHEGDEATLLDTAYSTSISEARSPVELPVSQPFTELSRVDSPSVSKERQEEAAGGPAGRHLPDTQHQEALNVPPTLFGSLLGGAVHSDRKEIGLGRPTSESLNVPDGASESWEMDDRDREAQDKEESDLPSKGFNLGNLATFTSLAVGKALGVMFPLPLEGEGGVYYGHW
jgi:hypothetical protein